MPKNVLKFKVFVASPSDLLNERESIDEVIEELNRNYGSSRGVVIELLKWETHSSPGVAKDHVQSLINKDIGNDYDIFVGLLWKKFGTPTDKADSGTEEEYNNAYARYQEKSHPQILFYFKDRPPVSMDEIDPEELGKVKKFKQKIEGERVLHQSFSDVSALQQHLRSHIPKKIEELMEKTQGENTNVELVSIEETDLPQEDELGVFDYHEILEESMRKTSEAVSNIVSATETVGIEIGNKADEINRLRASRPQISRKDMVRIYRSVASFMSNYASRLETEVPIFSENFREGMKAISGFVNISSDFPGAEMRKNMIEAKEGLNIMKDNITAALAAMLDLRSQVSEIPRIEKNVNRSKTGLVNQLDLLLKDFRESIEIAAGLDDEMSRKLDV